MPLRPAGVELYALANGPDISIEEALTTYFKLGEALRLDRLRHDALSGMEGANYWERLATRRLIEDIRRHQAQATAMALNEGGLDSWLREHDSEKRALVSQLSTLSSANANFAQFTLAADAVRGFMSDAAKQD